MPSLTRWPEAALVSCRSTTSRRAATSDSRGEVHGQVTVKRQRACRR
ncbi:hypothetical protein F4560_000913 [Saccharothrix ecbatanensis]|uniref:Uncharacterized protein n=1 Tax=Saccharothrix ecbatanensis TaxID=1105145 RepID=A0A7W9LYR2_9PSEU|nr:hypothetical protein [Saccharothrix ecbatanensis]